MNKIKPFINSHRFGVGYIVGWATGLLGFIIGAIL